jgi:hypothetical protein
MGPLFTGNPLAVHLAVALAIAAGGCQPSASRDPIDVRSGASEQPAMSTDGASTGDPLSYPGPGTVAANRSASGVASHGPYPPPATAATAWSLPAALAAALRDCDTEALDSLKTWEFSLRNAQSGGVDVMSTDGAGPLFADTLCLPSGQMIEFVTPPASLRPVTETMRGAYNPAMAIQSVLFVRGRGADGRGEARLLLLRDTDGRVAFGAAEYAPAGFGAIGDGAIGADVERRTVRMTLDKQGHGIEIDIPVGWSTERTGGTDSVMSFLPYAYAFSDHRNTKGFEAGQTKIEFYAPRGPERESVDDVVGSIKDYGDVPPKHMATEDVLLATGQPAVLARYDMASGPYTSLFVKLGEGVLKIPCWGDQTPCEGILRRARIR